MCLEWLRRGNRRWGYALFAALVLRSVFFEDLFDGFVGWASAFDGNYDNNSLLPAMRRLVAIPEELLAFEFCLA